MNTFEYQPNQAEKYGEFGIKGTTYEMAFTEAEKIFRNLEGQQVLDFGSGTGRSSRFLKSLGAEKVIGVDHNKSMINTAQVEEGIEYHLISKEIPLKNESVDSAFSSYAFIESKDLEAMKKDMAEIARTVKPGGLLVMITANPEAFGHDFKSYSRLSASGKLESGDVTKCTVKGENSFDIEDVYWTEEDYKKVLESAGFTVEEISFLKAESGDDWLDETEVAPEMVIKARKDDKL